MKILRGYMLDCFDWMDGEEVTINRYASDIELECPVVILDAQVWNDKLAEAAYWKHRVGSKCSCPHVFKQDDVSTYPPTDGIYLVFVCWEGKPAHYEIYQWYRNSGSRSLWPGVQSWGFLTQDV